MFWRRKTLRTSKLARRRRTIFLLKSAGVFVFVCGVLAAVVYGLNREEIQIQELAISGTRTLPSDEIERFVYQQLEGNYFFLIPKSNILLYPKNSLEAGVLENFKRVKKADITFSTWRSIRIDVVEREPHALWCGENRLEGAVPNCYFLDANGFVYASAPTFTGDVYFRFYGPLLAGEPVGQMYLEKGEYRVVDHFLKGVEEVGITAVELAVRDDADYELYLKEGAQVLIGREQNLERTLDTMQSVFLSEDFNQIPLSDIEYIDMRFGNKVYYKVRTSEEREQVEENTKIESEE